MTINARKEAALALEEILCRGGYSSLTVHKILKQLPADTPLQERRLLTSLVYTTLEHLISIDAVLKTYSKTPLSKMKPYVQICLRLGICQLRFLNGIPAHAAIHETVELVKRSRYRGLAGFVNGVLRAAQREGCAYSLPDAAKEPVQYLSLAYDMPKWIVTEWIESYGKEQAEALLAKMLKPGRVCLRANTLQAALPVIAEKLQARGAKQSSLVPEAFYMEHLDDVGSWPEYQQGWIAVQDESSLLAVLATGVKPGDCVLDMCAAPGGKSTFMAQLMQDCGQIVSRDLHAHRVALIEENSKRLGTACIRAEVADSTQSNEADRENYDVVLLDAPCSGLGMLRAKPDIKLHHTPQDSETLVLLQRELLAAAAKAVKPGGRLVYSTCTLSRRENEDQMAWFLERNADFTLKDLEKCLHGLPECDRLWKNYLTLWPQENGHDGFFVACLEKKRTEKEA